MCLIIDNYKKYKFKLNLRIGLLQYFILNKKVVKMKTNLPSHIDRWSFNSHKTYSFFEKYDLVIVIAVFTLAYFIIF